MQNRETATTPTISNANFPDLSEVYVFDTIEDEENFQANNINALVVVEYQPIIKNAIQAKQLIKKAKKCVIGRYMDCLVIWEKE
ncbi:MAG: hypothetical protein U0Y10_17865 [Spirosomataceae bacterium]